MTIVLVTVLLVVVVGALVSPYMISKEDKERIDNE